MRTIYSDELLFHQPGSEFHRGELVAPFEIPERVESVLAAIRDANLGPIDPPAAAAIDAAIRRVHRPEFVEFLRTAHNRWRELGREGDAVPVVWPVRGMRQDRIPTSLDGQLSYFSFDMATPITAGTWAASRTSVEIALTCVDSLETERAIFGLCRPPGHHAGYDTYGGYGYLNNAAIAAQQLRETGSDRVGILDVDYHHGNGTQSIFYSRSDVVYTSIHADPNTDYPYFLGHADETGTDAGAGCNFNFPLPRGTKWPEWSAALDSACNGIAGCDTLIVSLGVDALASDPISAFELTGEDYNRMGRRIAELRKPTIFLMEGGYAVPDIGTAVVNTLRGFEG